MKTRVTITLEPEVHRLAKETARRRRTSVSGLLASLVREEASRSGRSVVAGMVGCASLREPVGKPDPLYEALAAKHLGE